MGFVNGKNLEHSDHTVVFFDVGERGVRPPDVETIDFFFIDNEAFLVSFPTQDKDLQPVS